MRRNEALAEAVKMYYQEDAVVMYIEAQEAGLSGAELLADPAAVMRDCNGIGAAWMSNWARNLCNQLSPVMVLPAAIHDRRYAIGGQPGQLYADNEFLVNCLTMIERRYGWWNPLRYIMRHRAQRYYSYLRTFGAIAYGGQQA